MKVISGSPFNISGDIIGKITHGSSIFSSKSNLIYVTAEKTFPNGFAAVVTSNSRESTPVSGNVNVPVVYGVSGAEELSDGDVVSINPSGSIVILFKKGAAGNAIFVTGKCNCSCVMCPQPPVSDELDKTDYNLKIISLIDKSTSTLGLTGGEPTLKGDKFIELLQACKKFLPKTEINLLSNGINFADLDFAKRVCAVQHPCLVIDIPLYAVTDMEHNAIVGASVFYKVIKSLYNLALLRQRIGVRIVVIRQNSKRLKALAEFIYRNFPFVVHVAFMQMEQMGLAKKNINTLWIDPQDYAQELSDAVIYLATRDMNVSIYNSQLCVLSESVWRFSRKSISTWKNVYLNECNSCVKREECGGLFSSSGDPHSSYIKAFKNT